MVFDKCILQKSIFLCNITANYAISPAGIYASMRQQTKTATKTMIETAKLYLSILFFCLYKLFDFFNFEYLTEKLN